MSRLSRSARAVLVLSAVALGAAACGSAAKPTSGTTGSGNGTGTNAPAAPAGSGGKWPASPAGTFGVEPKVVVPSSAPPATLVTHDLIVGTGPAAKDGDTVSVKYVGVTYSTKKVFSQSWSPYQPFSFELGAGQVIPGWDKGVVGMKAGGRRELIIPPALAYGTSPPPGSGIPVNATLIFIVDVLKVTPPPAG